MNDVEKLFHESMQSETFAHTVNDRNYDIIDMMSDENDTGEGEDL